MSWPDLIATSGAHAALIWQYSWQGVAVFRGCSSLAEVSEDSITSSVYKSRSRDDCFYSAFSQKDSKSHCVSFGPLYIFTVWNGIKRNERKEARLFVVFV